MTLKFEKSPRGVKGTEWINWILFIRRIRNISAYYGEGQDLEDGFFFIILMMYINVQHIDCYCNKGL